MGKKILDYSIKPFQVLIGDLDVTPLITKFEVARPIHELKQHLAFSGNFELCWSPSTGITTTQLSQFTNPGYFRPYQCQCSFSIQGYIVCKFYIQDYVFDSYELVGKAKIVQILDVPGSRPSKEVLKELSDYGTQLGTVIVNLLNYAFDNSSIPTPTYLFDLNNHTGTYDDRLTSRDPVKDAQDICSKNYRWLYIDTLNRINDVSGDPSKNSTIFARSNKEVEIKPIFDHVNFASNQFIITGSKRQSNRSTGYNVVVKIDSGDEDTKNNFDSEGRQLRLVTQTFKKKWEVFPELATTTVTDSQGRLSLQITDTSDIIYERKVVQYYYWNVNPPYPTIETFKPVNPLSANTDTTQYLPQITDFASQWKKGDLVATVTTTQRIGGALYPVNAGTSNRIFDTGLRFYEQTIEVPYAKITYRCKGLVDVQLTGDYNVVPDDSPVLVSSEPIKGGRIDPNGTVPEASNPKKADEPLTFKTELPLESRHQKPDLNLETINLQGVANFQPVGWTPVRNDPYVEDIRFIPDQEHADLLAYEIGWRECRRRDSWDVRLPIPLEWLQNGCVPLQNCKIGNLHLQIDEEIISLENGKMVFAFTGNTIGFIDPPVPEPPDNVPFLPSQTLYLQTQSFTLVVGRSYAIELTVLGGMAPYTFSGTGFSSDFNISSDGIVSGTPTVPGINTASVTVTDSLSNTLTTTLTLIIVAPTGSISPVSPVSDLEESGETGDESLFIIQLEDGSLTSDEATNSYLPSAVLDGCLTDYFVSYSSTSQSVIVDGCLADQLVTSSTPTAVIDGNKTDVLISYSSSSQTTVLDGCLTDANVPTVINIPDGNKTDWVSNGLNTTIPDGNKTDQLPS